MPSRSITKRQKFWRDHVLAAAAYKGLIVEYAKTNSLKTKDISALALVEMRSLDVVCYFWMYFAGLFAFNPRIYFFTMHCHMIRRLDADADLFALHTQYSNGDLITDDN